MGPGPPATAEPQAARLLMPVVAASHEPALCPQRWWGPSDFPRTGAVTGAVPSEASTSFGNDLMRHGHSPWLLPASWLGVELDSCFTNP